MWILKQTALISLYSINPLVCLIFSAWIVSNGNNSYTMSRGPVDTGTFFFSEHPYIICQSSCLLHPSLACTDSEDCDGPRQLTFWPVTSHLTTFTKISVLCERSSSNVLWNLFVIFEIERPVQIWVWQRFTNLQHLFFFFRKFVTKQGEIFKCNLLIRTLLTGYLPTNK